MSVWHNCRGCRLCETRRQVVLGHGARPAQLLLVGEAPGKSEDLLGKPFVGPSGRLLRLGLEAAARMAGVPAPATYITNVVACRPCDYRHGPNRAPEPSECIACRPRLVADVIAARPQRVVLLGDVAAREAAALCPDGVHVRHPAYLLRLGGSSSGAWRGWVRSLADVIEGIR
jgi:DNA polymerase